MAVGIDWFLHSQGSLETEIYLALDELKEELEGWEELLRLMEDQDPVAA